MSTSEDAQPAKVENVAHTIVQPGEAAVTNSPIVTKPPKESSKVSYSSLPHKAQLAILCLARLADPMANTSIQSYMYFQLSFFDPSASSARISTQAGIIIGAKTAAQVCTGMIWGRIADSEYGGRKTVLALGLSSAAVSAIGYGFSRSFASAVAWQVFGGLMNSNVSMVRCITAELNPEKRYRTRALLLLPLCANAGMLIGPLVGGFLSAENGTGLLKTYPYALPNIFNATLYTIATLGVIFNLDETLEILQHGDGSFASRIWKKFIAKVRGRSSVEHAYTALSGSEPTTPVSPTSHTIPAPTSEPPKRKSKLPFWRIWTFNVICTMLSHFIIAGHLGTFSSLWAMFLQTPIGARTEQHPPLAFTGGLGMRPRAVGFAMSLLGAIGVILQAAVYPLLNDRYGTVRTWRAALYVFPVVYLLAPFPSLVASAATPDDATRTAALVWLAMGGVLLLFTLGRMGVTPATTLLINDCTPHPSVRATIHTTGTLIGNLSRSIFPVAALAIFGRGLQIGIVGLAFWSLAGLALLACVASRWVTEGSNGKEIILEGDEETQPELTRRQ